MSGRTVGRALFGLLAASALLAGCSKANVQEPTPLQDIVSPKVKPETEWTASVGDGSGKYYGELSTAVAVDAVFGASVDGYVYAFDPKSGDRIWRTDLDVRVISGPTVSGNAVFIGTMDGEVIALKRADGSVYWRKTLSSEVLAAPVSDGNVVVVHSGDGRVYGLSAVSGQEIWAFDRLVPNLTLRGLARPVVDGSLAMIGMDNGRIAALRMQDGQPIWEQVVAAATGRNELERLTDVDASLLLDGSDLYAASFGGEMVCVDRDTGQVLWRRGIKSFTGFARVDDLVVITDASGVVWGLDARTGAAAWSNDNLKYRRLSPPAVFDGKVVVGDYKGYLHWLDPKDGRLIGRSRAGSDPIRTAPVVQDGLMYVMNTSGRLSAIKLK